MKWSQAVCASILVEGLRPPTNKVPGARGAEGRFQEAYVIFGTYADDRFLPRIGTIVELLSLADLPRA